MTQAASATALIVVSLSLSAERASAGAEERKSTAGASELLIPFGPRGTALGSSVTADASGVEALYWNPAGLAEVERTEAFFSYSRYFADMNLSSGAVAARFGDIGTVGIGAKVLSVGDIIETTEDAPEGTGTVFSPTFGVLSLTYARQFTDRVRFGATVDYINERVLDVSARGVAFDLGVQYDTGWRGFAFGLVMKNFGPGMTFGGSGFETDIQQPGSDPTSSNRTFSTVSASFDLPSYFVAAATYNVFATEQHRLSVKTGFQSNNFSGDNVWGGAEWTYHEALALRASYFGSFVGTTDPLTGAQTSGYQTGDDLYTGYALGAGVNFKAGDSKIAADFAWRPVRDFFNDSLEFALKVGL